MSSPKHKVFSSLELSGGLAKNADRGEMPASEVSPTTPARCPKYKSSKGREFTQFINAPGSHWQQSQAACLQPPLHNTDPYFITCPSWTAALITDEQPGGFALSGLVSLEALCPHPTPETGLVIPFPVSRDTVSGQGEQGQLPGLGPELGSDTWPSLHLCRFADLLLDLFSLHGGLTPGCLPLACAL